MRITRTRIIVLSTLTVLLVAGLGYAGYALTHATQTIKVQMHPRGITDARLVERDSVMVYEVTTVEGQHQTMSPDEFARAVWDGRQATSFGEKILVRVLNVSSLATIGWVVVGLAGQIIFAGRMIVQWIASERARQSVIPPSFWWMALVGASLLLVYFVWRKDIVGILGQVSGWLIYTRNLYFIYRQKYAKQPEAAANEEEVPTATSPVAAE